MNRPTTAERIAFLVTNAVALIAVVLDVFVWRAN